MRIHHIDNNNSEKKGWGSFIVSVVLVVFLCSLVNTCFLGLLELWYTLHLFHFFSFNVIFYAIATSLMKSGIGCHALFFARMALLWILLLLCGGLQFSRAQNFPPTFNPVVESINILELTMENSGLSYNNTTFAAADPLPPLCRSFDLRCQRN